MKKLNFLLAFSFIFVCMSVETTRGLDFDNVSFKLGEREKDTAIENDQDQQDDVAKRCAEFLTDGRLFFVMAKAANDSKETIRECFKAAFEYCKLSHEQMILLQKDVDTLSTKIAVVARAFERFKEIYDYEVGKNVNNIIKRAKAEESAKKRVLKEFPELATLSDEITEMSLRWADFGSRVSYYMADEIAKRKFEFMAAGIWMLKAAIDMTTSVVNAQIAEQKQQ